MRRDLMGEAPAASPDTGTDGAREGMTEERLEAALWIARALETHGDLHGAAPFLRELRMEVLRLRARPDTGDARLREAAEHVAMTLDAILQHTTGMEILSGLRDCLRAALADAETPEEGGHE